MAYDLETLSTMVDELTAQVTQMQIDMTAYVTATQLANLGMELEASITALRASVDLLTTKSLQQQSQINGLAKAVSDLQSEA